MKCLFESVDCEDRNSGECSRGDCVFAPQDNAESPSHSLQQLKAEIAALYKRAFSSDVAISEQITINDFCERVRQLSAV